MIGRQIPAIWLSFPEDQVRRVRAAFAEALAAYETEDDEYRALVEGWDDHVKQEIAAYEAKQAAEDRKRKERAEQERKQAEAARAKYEAEQAQWEAEMAAEREKRAKLMTEVAAKIGLHAEAFELLVNAVAEALDRRCPEVETEF
jgi:septal ring factor EnvC (AmiA/AmiB activator)